MDFTNMVIGLLYSCIAIVLMAILYKLTDSILKKNREVQKWINFLFKTEIYPTDKEEWIYSFLFLIKRKTEKDISIIKSYLSVGGIPTLMCPQLTNSGRNRRGVNMPQDILILWRELHCRKRYCINKPHPAIITGCQNMWLGFQPWKE